MKITQTGTYIPISAPTAPYLEIFTTDKPPVSGSKTPHHIPCGRYTQRRQSPAPACTRAKRTISGFTARIFREPPLAHTFPLLEKLRGYSRTKRTRRRRKSIESTSPSTQTESAAAAMPSTRNIHHERVPNQYSALMTSGWKSPMIRNVKMPTVSPVRRYSERKEMTASISPKR